MQETLEIQDRVERALARCVTEVVILINADFVIEYASPNSDQIGGWLPVQLNGRSALDLIQPSDALLIAEMLERVQGNPAGVDGTVELESMDVRAKGIGGDLLHANIRFVNMLDDPQVAAILVLVAPVYDPLTEAFGPIIAELTKREHAVVTMIADGYRVSTISEDLELSASTVRNHLSSIFNKLDVKNQSELVARLARAQVS